MTAPDDSRDPGLAPDAHADLSGRPAIDQPAAGDPAQAAAPPDPDRPPAAAPRSSPSLSRPDVDDIGVSFRRSDALDGVSVAVVGGGAIGIWVAFYLWLAGAKVTVFDDGRLRTFLTAAGWIHPYHSTDPRTIPIAMRAMKLWQMHRTWLPAGSVTAEYCEVQRAASAQPFPRQFRNLPDYQPLPKTRILPTLKSGFSATTLVAPAQKWHAPMKRRLVREGVTWVDRHLETADDFTDLFDEGAEFVIDCAGLGSAFAFDDHMFLPLRGTVVYLKETPDFEGVYSWDLDAGDFQDPYAIYQRALGRIVVGGETLPMSFDACLKWIEDGCRPEEAVGAMLLDRIYSYVPALRGLDVLGVATGIRPARDRLLLGVDADVSHMIHASGFGGFGVTCAPEVGTMVLKQVDAIHKASRRRRR
jgi:glycine/D-amino acid oxidase-like deaminating enzyme